MRLTSKWRERRYLYRAIHGDGHTLDIQLCRTRNHQAASTFMKRLVKHFGEPSVLTTDKAPTLPCAFKKLQKDRFYTHIKHCTIKQYNWHVKRRFAKFTEFQINRHALLTIKGKKTIQALYKQRRSLSSNSAFSAYNTLQELFKSA